MIILCLTCKNISTLPSCEVLPPTSRIGGGPPERPTKEKGRKRG